MTYPFKELITDRLILAEFGKTAAETWIGLIKDKEVALTTLSLPHPCTCKDAKLWKAAQIDAIKSGGILRWSIIKKRVMLAVMGCVKLSLNLGFNSAEIGYWVGKNTGGTDMQGRVP